MRKLGVFGLTGLIVLLLWGTPTGASPMLATAYGITPLSMRGDIPHHEIYVEILNTNTWDACDVRLRANFYDFTGAFLGTSTGTPMLDVVPAGSLAPVAIFVSNSYSANRYVIHHYTVEVINAAPCTIAREPLTLLDVNSTNPPTGLEVKGTVRNDTALTLDRGKAVVTVYYTDGGIWFAYYAAIFSKPLMHGLPPWLLLPGGRGEFIIVTGAKDLSGLRYTIQAQAEQAASRWVIP